MPEISSLSVWRRSMQRSTKLLLAIVLLVQPGCMCGCSSPQHFVCQVDRCDGKESCDVMSTVQRVVKSESYANQDNLTAFQGVLPESK